MYKALRTVYYVLFSINTNYSAKKKISILINIFVIGFQNFFDCIHESSFNAISYSDHGFSSPYPEILPFTQYPSTGFLHQNVLTLKNLKYA